MIRTIGILVIAALVSMSACGLIEAMTSHIADLSCHGDQKPSNDNSDRKMQQCCQKGLFKKEVKPVAPLVAAFNCVLISDTKKIEVQILPAESSNLYLDTGQHLAKLSLLRI